MHRPRYRLPPTPSGLAPDVLGLLISDDWLFALLAAMASSAGSTTVRP